MRARVHNLLFYRESAGRQALLLYANKMSSVGFNLEDNKTL